MSHGKLRQEKNCLNCDHIVEERFCPHCGQENTEIRQPFYYLFTHFFEDFTHYDGQFWKTMRYLVFAPGRLTKIYLLGKRQSYVPPVKLYIFISFVTFFIASFVGLNINNKKSHGEDSLRVAPIELDSATRKIALDAALSDPLLTSEDSLNIRKALGDLPVYDGIKADNIGKMGDISLKDANIGDTYSLAEYDSLINKNHSFIRKLLRPFVKKFFEFKEQELTFSEIAQNFLIVFMHTLPKALFFYLPFFAFILWVFHDKKKWWYFDHGVFTLHYFSFLLLIVLFFLILNLIEPMLNSYSWFNYLSTWLYAIAIIYASIYFFIAHRRYYGTRKRKSILIGITVFFINTFAFSILLLMLALMSLLLIH